MLNAGSSDTTYEPSLGLGFLTVEYIHAALGWKNHSLDRYMCSEAVAEIIRAGGTWSSDRTNVMPLDIKRRVSGRFWQVF